jgi:hypothetical protein
MSSSVSQFVNVLLEISAITALVAVPCLTILAYRSGSKHGRQQDMPKWRGTLGTISIAATFFSWVPFVGVSLMIGLGFHNHVNSVAWLLMIALSSITGLSFAIALRGPARAQTLFAALLMIFLLLTSVNI